MPRKPSRLFIPVLSASANLLIDMAVEKAGLKPRQANVARVIGKATVLAILGLMLGAETSESAAADTAAAADASAPTT